MKKILTIGLIGYSLFYEIDHEPLPGESIIAKSIAQEIGAKAFNEAYTVHLFGGNVKFISTIGSDEFKNIIASELNKTGLESKIIYKDGPNTIASIISYKNNNVFVNKGVELTKDDFDVIKENIEEADIIILTNEIEKELLKLIIDYSNQLNKYIMLNLSPVKKCNYFEKANLVIMNEIEYEQFNDLEQNELVDLIITNGAGNILYKTKNDIYEIKVFPISQIEDTTGAGDIFIASLAYFLSKESIISKEVIVKGIDYASKLASKSIQYKYVMESIKEIAK